MIGSPILEKSVLVQVRSNDISNWNSVLLHNSMIGPVLIWKYKWFDPPVTSGNLTILGHHECTLPNGKVKVHYMGISFLNATALVTTTSRILLYHNFSKTYSLVQSTTFGHWTTGCTLNTKYLQLFIYSREDRAVEFCSQVSPNLFWSIVHLGQVMISN